LYLDSMLCADYNLFAEVPHLNAVYLRRSQHLSTQLEPPSESAVEGSSPSDKLSLQALVATLQTQRTPPTLQQLSEWLEKAEISCEELKPYIGFKEGNYWRHRVCRNEAVEMLVLCWGPGHRTPIHDHNGSHGAVKVYDGVLWETTFAFDEKKGLSYKGGREYRRGQVTGAEIPDIHQLGNPDVSGQSLITIHIYAPPLGVLRTYKVGSPEIDLYIPDDSAA